MAKVLKLTFNLEGNSTMTVSISSPKDGLDAAAVETAAAGLMPVLEGTGGAAAAALKGASYIVTTETPIV